MRLHDFIEYHARVRPDREFAIQGSHSMTYAEANVEANRLANGLVSVGLEVGDRFAYLSKNSIDMALMNFAAAKVGAVPVPLNYRLAPPEWAYIINDAEAKLVIAAGDHPKGIDSVRDKLKSAKAFRARGDGPQGGESYRDWVGEQAETDPGREITDRNELYQMYTSGTTGHPKGAIQLHRAVISNVSQLMTSLTIRPGPGDRTLIVAPMYHAAAAISVMATVISGATLVIQEDFDPAAVIRELSEGDIAWCTLVPAMIQACLVMVPDVAERRYPALQIITYGASPIAEDTLRNAMKVFGCGFHQGFGMTETTAAVTVLTEEDHVAALAGRSELLLSAGRAITGTEVRIVDENDVEVARGEVGEIIARGPQIMKGYWNLPEASEKALKGGWMHTGDAAIMDEEGYIYIQDRIKDMIVSGGENVYPREIENALFEHEAIIDAAVIGIPDAKFGEAILAFVVTKPGTSLSVDDVIAHSRDRIAGYKVPRQVEFIAELPRNASGKVLKKDLREPYWEGQKRRVGG